MEVISDSINTASHEHLLNWTKSIKLHIKVVVQLFIRLKLDIGLTLLKLCEGRPQIILTTWFSIQIRTLSQLKKTIPATLSMSTHSFQPRKSTENVERSALLKPSSDNSHKEEGEICGNEGNTVRTKHRQHCIVKGNNISEDSHLNSVCFFCFFFFQTRVTFKNKFKRTSEIELGIPNTQKSLIKEAVAHM